MIITFFTKDGQFTTDKFNSIRDAKEYLDESLYPIMIENIESLGQDRAAIFIPNGEVSIYAKKKHSNKRRVVKYPDYKYGYRNEDDYQNDRPISKKENVPDSEKTFFDDLEGDDLKYFNLKMMRKLAISSAQEEYMKDRKALEEGEMNNMAYAYFKKNIKRLYTDPEWEEFRKRYDSEKKI